MVARSNWVAIDLGTGDGRAALERARREPRSLVIGIDANAAAMAGSSRRAARRVARGGLPNAVFVVASAEHPPAELIGRADELTLVFPWGSLLRGALGVDEAAARGIAALVRPGGLVTALLSVTDRDGAGLPRLDASAETALAERWSPFGLRLGSFRPAGSGEIAATRSSWARRLSAGRDRPVWRIELAAFDAAEEAVADAI